MPAKSIGEGASSLFWGWPGSPENVSCSRATPDLHRCNLGVALKRHFRDSRPSPKRLLSPSPIHLGAIWEFGGCTRQSGSQRYSACEVDPVVKAKADALLKKWNCSLHATLRYLLETCTVEGWAPIAMLAHTNAYRPSPSFVFWNG